MTDDTEALEAASDPVDLFARAVTASIVDEVADDMGI
jgi:hypothetical protein